MIEVKLVKAKAFVLNPKKKYLLIVDKNELSIHDVYNLTEALGRKGIDSIAVAVKSNENIKIVEA